MKFEMKPLPYDYNALEPHISERTLKFHYDKHHAGYMKKLKGHIEGTPQASESLEQLIEKADGGVFNTAAQVWNHDFYWSSLSPDGGGKPGSGLAKALDEHFGGTDKFLAEMKKAATGHFGSGWAWLVGTEDGKLAVTSTHDADNPIRHGQVPLLTIDVWEHAYYLDTQNDRGEYVDRVLDKLINWQFAEDNYNAFMGGSADARRAS